MKIFISYNHNDQRYALKIKDQLTANGWEVLIDAEKMRSGEDIEQFIMTCIRDSNITVTLISANSLLSAWVAMETIATSHDEKIRERRFIPCYIDKEFFNHNFTGEALVKIEANLKEIGMLMTSAIEKGWGIEDLQRERTRYLKMKANLPEIIGKLRNSLCVDLTDEHFEAGMQKIIDDLKQPGRMKDAPIKIQTAAAINQLQNSIRDTLDDISKQRLTGLHNRLIQLQQLLSKYEEELDFETDPKRQMRYEREIGNTKNAVQKILDEIKVL